MITGGFTDQELAYMKGQVALIRLDDKSGGHITHACSDEAYRRRYNNCFCMVEITRKFVDLIQDIMGHPVGHYLNAPWVAIYGDTHRFDIFGTRIVVRICAGRIGCLDGKPTKDHEVTIYSRTSPSGKYDKFNNSVYEWSMDRDVEAPHGRATDRTIWKAHAELVDLRQKNIDDIVAQFCYVLE